MDILCEKGMCSLCRKEGNGNGSIREKRERRKRRLLVGYYEG